MGTKGILKSVFRYCRRCGGRFQPDGRFQRICGPCATKARNKAYEKQRKRKINLDWDWREKQYLLKHKKMKIGVPKIKFRNL